eukprot:TRINITY_DN23040_c0_g1_i1.p1 TRINITY_DN23040_c0_g1~~TRINITY_DN23040_c0_g1_i1.p1  ORF type:complete len:322 (+),score=98.67 TRINITY_DN23040_c0_g1_i1:63-1028(+)
MMRVAALCLLPALVSCQGGTNGEVEFANSPIGQFERKDVNFSFYLNCHDACFITTTGAVRGTFNRRTFREALGTAYNTVAARKRTELEASLTAQHPNGQFSAFVTQTFFDLGTSFDPAVADTIYSSIRFDRVVESSDVSTVTGRVKTPNGAEVVPSNFWNSFVRVSMLSIPENIADNFNDVIVELSTSYPAQIKFDSLWISTDAFFITDQLEPVRGRGHKSTRLLIPLLMGVVAMLVVPMIVSAAFVHVAQSAQKDQVRIEQKEKEIANLNRARVEKDAALNTFDEREMELKGIKDSEMEKMRLRDQTELTEQDCDWMAKN